MMTSNQPYLLRAFYDWIMDNECTPYILVDTQTLDLDIPQDLIDQEKVLLDISRRAVRKLRITNQIVEFDATFSGRFTSIYIPIKSVLAIYALENGRGIVFMQDDDTGEDNKDPPSLPPRFSAGEKPKLTIVKK